MPNRLAGETSPYLLQHKENPVDWYPWSDAAIAASTDRDMPIFLSIGYSACHWCHVMERESFENEQIAQLVNENFVPIKVDREERPDLDQIYMQAVQMLTGRGGWPMSVFLTPDLQPFYGGTYWPPHASRGMPGFDQVLAGVAQAWANRRDEVLAGANEICQQIERSAAAAVAADDSSAGLELTYDVIEQANWNLSRAFDSTWGGFGRAPKFPHCMDMKLLLRHYNRMQNAHAVQMVRTTLDKMAAGGIYDHLGGGFARYSVDDRWLVPHFEKMLYDNALLAQVYVEAYQVTGVATYKHVAHETLDYVLRDMTDPRGGFYSAEDADSEGEEGLFYTWTRDEVEAVLGTDRAEVFSRVYDVSDIGNFEGRSILNLPKTIGQCARLLQRDETELSEELRVSRTELFAEREKRVRPGRDDKVLVSWNGMMIEALARAGVVLDQPRFTEAAAKASQFILTELRDADRQLLHTWRDGTAKIPAFADDYACLASGLVTLYETSFDEKWLDHAVQLVDTARSKFEETDAGGFFIADAQAKDLIVRSKEFVDASVPSGNGMMAELLLRLGHLTGNNEYLESAERTLRAAAGTLTRAPMAASQLLLALNWHVGPVRQLALVVDETTDDAARLRQSLAALYDPLAVRAACNSNKQAASPGRHLQAIFEGRLSASDPAALYICQGFSCDAPLVGSDAVMQGLQKLKRA